MNTYETLLEQIKTKAFTNLEIALMAIAYWMIESPGMNATNLADIMTRIGYTFDVQTQILSDGTNSLGILSLITNAIDNIYTTSNLSAAALRRVIKKAYAKSYVTAEQQTTLLASLATATAGGQ